MQISPAFPDNQTIRELRDAVVELNRTSGKANRRMLALTAALVDQTVVIAILTGMMAWAAGRA